MSSTFGLPAFAATVLLSACSLNPPQLGGKFAEVNTAQASTDKFAGTDVRWGGIVAGARSTDNGTCLEIGWYPLNQITWQPSGLESNHRGSIIGQPLYNQTPHTVFYSSGNRIETTPRFLACGAAASDSERYFTGSVVTVAGTIESPKIYVVDYAECVRDDQLWKADYSGTSHTSNDDTCVVSLPVLKIKGIVAWKQPPSSRFYFQPWGW